MAASDDNTNTCAVEWAGRVFVDFDSEAAISAYERAIALKPDRVRNYHALARIHEDAGRADKAIAIRRQAVDANAE